MKIIHDAPKPPFMRLPTKFHYLFILLINIVLISSTEGRAQCTFKNDVQIEETAIGNLITWTTITESPNLRFLVQKSSDGWNFTSIGELKGLGHNEEQYIYRFLDYSIGHLAAYYRIMVISSTGKFKQTPAIYIQRKHSNNLMLTGLSPTATDKSFNFTVRSTEKIDMEVYLETLERQKIRAFPASLIAGSNLISIDLENLPIGSYRLVLTAGSEREEVVIQKINPGDILPVGYFVKE